MTQPEGVLFFCHGVPGSEQDAQLVPGLSGAARVYAPNLLVAGGHEAHLLEQFDSALGADGGHVGCHVVGFSIGAMAALKLAAARPDKVQKVTLISPAAPLSLGAFLPDMAGAPVFAMAMRRPGLLRVLTGLQALMVRVAPGMLIKQLFAKCGPQERALLEDARFLEALKAGLNNSYVTHRAGYLNYLDAYVEDWAAHLAQVHCHVEIWHGDKDTWAPLAMAQALQAALPGKSALHVAQGGEHYSTLRQVALSG